MTNSLVRTGIVMLATTLGGCVATGNGLLQKAKDVVSGTPAAAETSSAAASASASAASAAKSIASAVSDKVNPPATTPKEVCAKNNVTLTSELDGNVDYSVAVKNRTGEISYLGVMDNRDRGGISNIYRQVAKKNVTPTGYAACVEAVVNSPAVAAVPAAASAPTAPIAAGKKGTKKPTNTVVTDIKVPASCIAAKAWVAVNTVGANTGIPAGYESARLTNPKAIVMMPTQKGGVLTVNYTSSEADRKACVAAVNALKF